MVQTQSTDNVGAKPKQKETSRITKAYLIIYNFLQTIGWTYLLYKVVLYYLDPNPAKESVYDTVKCTLILFQNAAILEVVHAAAKLVASSPIITFQQISSRVIVVCGILMATDAARVSIGVPLLLFAWSITEIIRYATYTLSLLNSVPYVLVWLRYTTFIVLYPIGVTGELLCMYAGQKEVGENGLWSIHMPNMFNVIFCYDYFLIFVMLLYIPLFPKLYLHMFSQRKKVIGTPTEKKVR